jgi:putative nucleotidyltransferase with HDIG domain
MDRINPLELVGNKSLDYDLYDEKGQILYHRGSELTPGVLMMLNYKEVYKEREPFKLPEINPNLYSPEEREPNPVIPQETSEFLIERSKVILTDLAEGEPPDPKICNETNDVILDIVNEKIEKIECINQLRVYDEYTFSHTVNVCSLSTALGIKCGLNKDQIKELSLGALLHDVGKMRMSKYILNKPGKLEPHEFELMKKHTTYGYEILTRDMKIPEEIAIIAYQHQEKYGGKGYPLGLKANEITLYAQICAIADVYDALVSKRVYKDPIPSHEALKLMIKDGSFSFNPSLLYKFVYIANYKNSNKFVITD